MKKSIKANSDDTKHASRSKRSPVNRSKNANKQITQKKSKSKMIYVGIDAHKKFLQVAAVDEDGKRLLNERVATDHDSIKRFFAQFSRDKTKCVLESSSVWYGLFRYLVDELGFNVVLSNPYQTRAIAASKKKTDKVDAWTLADLLRLNYIPECYVSDLDTIESKQLVRHRQRYVRDRTRYKNLIHGIILQSGIKIDGNPFSKQYIKKLQQLGDYRIESYLRSIEFCNKEILEDDIKIATKVDKTRYAALLKTIPGIGNYSALVIAAEIGDIKRFHGSDKLCAYAGLVPSVRNSADKVIHGHITKRGSRMLRWILTEAVHVHVRHTDTNISRFYYKLAKKRGTSKATVAAAAKLLRVIYCVLAEDRKFVVS